jgi:hypothetical protein
MIMRLKGIRRGAPCGRLPCTTPFQRGGNVVEQEAVEVTHLDQALANVMYNVAIAWPLSEGSSPRTRDDEM